MEFVKRTFRFMAHIVIGIIIARFLITLDDLFHVRTDTTRLIRDVVLYVYIMGTAVFLSMLSTKDVRRGR